jgi:hypothetical protein
MTHLNKKVLVVMLFFTRADAFNFGTKGIRSVLSAK